MVILTSVTLDHVYDAIDYLADAEGLDAEMARERIERMQNADSLLDEIAQTAWEDGGDEISEIIATAAQSCVRDFLEGGM